MRISRIELKNFKRFTYLTIDSLPETAKLVLLIGSNGSGKSSLFDAFEAANSFLRNQLLYSAPHNSSYFSYYQKSPFQETALSISCSDDNLISFSLPTKVQNMNKQSLDKFFYGRSSFRHLPRLNLAKTGGNIDQDSDRPRFFIDRDERFGTDLIIMYESILKEVFNKLSIEKIYEHYVEPLNKALKNIFRTQNEANQLSFKSIIPSADDKEIRLLFQKGKSEISYDYLSAGEKEIFNLLLNLLVRKKQYEEAIYFLDEIDLHLNTQLQFNLLKEITENWIPEKSQLWTASHSLGFIEYANSSEQAVMINFDDLDFDLPVTLTPEPKGTAEVYEIAVGKEYLASLFQDKKVCFVEGKDQVYYASVGLEVIFVKGKNNKRYVYEKARADSSYGILDRDYLTDDDIEKITECYPHLKITKYYNIENYLYHPDNLEEYYRSESKTFDKAIYIQEITQEKNAIKNKLIIDIKSIRMSYPYFGESENKLRERFENKGENNQQTEMIVDYLNSDDFETYYKVLNMKSYCTQLPQRKDIFALKLAKTQWFKHQIQSLF